MSIVLWSTLPRRQSRPRALSRLHPPLSRVLSRQQAARLGRRIRVPHDLGRREGPQAETAGQLLREPRPGVRLGPRRHRARHGVGRHGYPRLVDVSLHPPLHPRVVQRPDHGGHVLPRRALAAVLRVGRQLSPPCCRLDGRSAARARGARQRCPAGGVRPPRTAPRDWIRGRDHPGVVCPGRGRTRVVGVQHRSDWAAVGVRVLAARKASAVGGAQSGTRNRPRPRRRPCRRCRLARARCVLLARPDAGGVRDGGWLPGSVEDEGRLPRRDRGP
ncbi:hypothetical protein C8Q80DRAFT_404221 [Daedaleopsis nitida]|nr:hypothetical protein C8Q80DRAFT_404221 [Daedaleopsis nitida]